MTRVPKVTRDQMIEIDRLMVEDAGISLIQMMENAGRSLADFIISTRQPSSVTVFAGRGGNGGGGLVAARHLSNRGVNVEVVTSVPADQFSGVPGLQLSALSETSAVIHDRQEAAGEVMVDALIGYSLEGRPTGRSAELIEEINASNALIVSLDLPSGVDATTGECPGVAVDADHTLTLALPKTGLQPSGRAGAIHVADISVPPELYGRLGLSVSGRMFSAAPIIHLS